MNLSTRSINAAAFSVALGLLVAAGCNKDIPPSSGGAAPAPIASQPVVTPPNTDALPADAPVVSKTAVEFHEECQKDKDAALDKYKKSVIELTGKVNAVTPDGKKPGRCKVYLDGKIACYPAELDAYGKVQDGATIKIKGVIGKDDFGTIVLQKCVFVDVGANPPSVVTAEQLVNEFASDEKAAFAKYAGKFAVLTGEVVSKTKGKRNEVLVRLKGSEKGSLDVEFNSFQNDYFDPIQPGQKVKLLVTVDVFKDLVLSTTFDCIFSKP